MAGQTFLRCFTRHLVPKGLRRVRYYGLLVGKNGRYREIPGAVQTSIGEKAICTEPPCCRRCQGRSWHYIAF